MAGYARRGSKSFNPNRMKKFLQGNVSKWQRVLDNELNPAVNKKFDDKETGAALQAARSAGIGEMQANKAALVELKVESGEAIEYPYGAQVGSEDRPKTFFKSKEEGERWKRRLMKKTGIEAKEIKIGKLTAPLIMEKRSHKTLQEPLLLKPW